ncbi:MAG TPA: peptide chain release factor 2 [Victivallales bacterium]|nr:peptide chain release factor 2 [Victivallales bacterium]HPO90683.1 peptide chain release factor 2 [Victivallales bacterium]HRR28913.1 peptide chain release factor 2 [Victivallales bacterium]HRU00422.1 peptide chain release factor 2 [Victivallales bacterium]
MTIEELKNHVSDSKERLDYLKKYLDIEKKIIDKNNIESEMLNSDFWNNREKAQEKIAKLSAVKKVIESYENLSKEIEEFCILAELVIEDGDEENLSELEKNWERISANLSNLELISFLSGKFDANNAYFSIHAGAGGTESCDWASILLRMYRRWFEKKGYEVEVIDNQPGEEAGIKGITMLVKGSFAYGYCKAERGVHRLVRISPFDSNARRHTSFAAVEVFPELDDDIEVQIDEKDLKIDTYRASGAGGQYVNRTDSAVRITHLPTGIVVSCQMERSQHKNRATAMKMLKAKLYELEEEKRKKEAENIKGQQAEIAWGSQIRSYVLHPYQLVKDLRTDVETGNTQAVLDGEIDIFVDAWLKSQKN